MNPSARNFNLNFRQGPTIDEGPKLKLGISYLRTLPEWRPVRMPHKPAALRQSGNRCGCLVEQVAHKTLVVTALGTADSLLLVLCASAHFQHKHGLSSLGRLLVAPHSAFGMRFRTRCPFRSPVTRALCVFQWTLQQSMSALFDGKFSPDGPRWLRGPGLRKRIGARLPLHPRSLTRTPILDGNPKHPKQF